MADIITPFWTSLRAVIGATWQEVLPANDGGGIHRVVSVQKIDWERITLPYCAVSLQMRLWTEGPVTAQVFDVAGDIYYIRKDEAGIVVTIDGKLGALNDTLHAYSFSAGQEFIDTLDMDSGETNRANQALLALNMPYSAGFLQGSFRVGQTL